MRFVAGERRHADELLDDPSTPRDEAERSLRDLERFNRFAGGQRVYRKMIRRLSIPNPSVLDIGAGTADMLAHLPRASFRVASDLSFHHLHYGEQRNPTRRVTRVVANALRLPFADDSFDVVTSSHFIHHFDEQEGRQLLDESLRVAREGVVFSDTRRALLPWLFTRLLGFLRLVGPVTRFDAPASIQRGFRREELETIGRSSGRRYRVDHYVPFRIVLTVWAR